MIRASFIATALVISTGLPTLAMGCDKHAQPTMSCVAGTVYDAESHSCVPTSS